MEKMYAITLHGLQEIVAGALMDTAFANEILYCTDDTMDAKLWKRLKSILRPEMIYNVPPKSD